MKARNKKRQTIETLPIFKPAMDDQEIEAVSEVVKSGWIGLGPKTAEFETLFARYVGAKQAVGLNSATAALHLSLIVSGVGQGDEVLMPALTFVSAAHVAMWLGAKPVFVDIDEETLCIDPADLARKITKKSKVIMPVDYGGHPADLDAILAIAKNNNLKVVEDASHAAGATYKGRVIGSIADLTCFSFHAVKNLATGDGGMVTTNDKKLAEIIRRLRWLGIDKDTWKRETAVKNKSYRNYGWFYDVSDLGYKYHMNDIMAAIGVIQLKKLAQNNLKRRRLYDRYNRELKKFSWLILPKVKEWAESAYHLYVIRTAYRDKLNLFLKRKKIASGVHYVPIHHFSFYRNKTVAGVPKTEKIWKTLLTLPLYPTLSFVDQDRVIGALEEFGRLITKKTIK